MSYTADDYRNAPSGNGPLAGQWADKPHRIAYDMANVLDKLVARLDLLRTTRSDRGRFGYFEGEADYVDGRDSAMDGEIEFLEELLQTSERKEFEGYA